MYLEGTTRTVKDAAGKEVGGKKHGEDALLKAQPQYLHNEFKSPRPTLVLEDLRTMIEDRKTLPYNSYAARDLSDAEVAYLIEYRTKAEAEQNKQLGEKLSAATSALAGQASANHQEARVQLATVEEGLHARLASLEAAVERGQNLTKNGHQLQREATTRKQEEAAAEYARLCEKFGHCLERPPAKLGEYIKAISDLKKQMAQREKEALLAAKQAEYEESLQFCPNGYCATCAAKDISTLTFSEKLRAFQNAIEAHRGMAEDAAKQAATDGDADVANPAAAETPTAAEHVVPATAAAKDKPARPSKRRASARAKAAQKIQKPTAGMRQEELEQLCQKHGLEATGTKKTMAKRLRKHLKKSAPAPTGALAAETTGAETSDTGGRKVVLALDSEGDVTDEVDVTREEIEEIVDKFGDQEVYPSDCTPMIKSILDGSARSSVKNCTQRPSGSSGTPAKRRKTAPVADPAGEASSEAD